MKLGSLSLASLAALTLIACASGGPGDDSSRPASSSASSPTPVVTTPAVPPPSAPPPAAPAPPAVTYAREWAVAPTGSDTAAGGPEAPFRTISKALTVAAPGHRITVRPGTYRERVVISGGVAAGTAASPIRLQGEPGAKLAPGSSSGTLLVIERPHWQVDGFEVDVEGRSYFAATMSSDVTGSVLSNSHLHHGTAGAGLTLFNGAVGMTIANNHIHHFIKSGADSHGVHVQPGSRNITVRDNIIHDNSGDSVQCEGYDVATQADGLLIEGNELYSDLEQAVDIKTCKNVRILNNRMRDYMYTSFPDGTAVVVHYDASNVTLEGNELVNVGKGISVGGNGTASNVVIRANRFRNVASGPQLVGLGVQLNAVNGVQLVNNTFAHADVAAVQVNLDSRNVTLKNNLFIPRGTGVAIHAPSGLSGFVSNTNLFAPGTRFSAGAFADWKALGRDLGSREADPQLNLETMVPGPNAIDWGERLGQTFCGGGPDLGAVETGC